MEAVYSTLKGFIDPVFIVFLLLLTALFVCIFNSRKKIGVLIMFLSIVLFYGASIFPVANYLCFYLEKNYINNQITIDKKIDAIVVLGGGSHDINYLKNTFLTETTSTRLLYGLKYYSGSGARYFVCSGKGTGQIAEAEVMAGLAEKLGVPKDRIRIDAKSTNTWENAAEINKMFANKNISLGVVTSAFHMKRSEREFKKYFNNIFPMPANYLYSSRSENRFLQYAPQTNSLRKTNIALKEIIGQLWYNLKSI